jgi:ABC-type transport system substrate-binding protein
VYAAHVPPASYRTSCIGTGPFKLKEWKKGEFVDYVKSPNYFIKGRPYLDGLRYVVIVERGTRTAAMQAGQLDVAMPGETSKGTMEQLRNRAPDQFNTVATTYRQHHQGEEGAVHNPVRLAVITPSTGGLIRPRIGRGGLGGAMWPGVWGMPERSRAAATERPTR